MYRFILKAIKDNGINYLFITYNWGVMKKKDEARELHLRVTA